MSGLHPYTLSSSKLQRSQKNVLRFVLTVATGQVSVDTSYAAPIIAGDANGDSSQSAVNALLEVDSTGADLSTTSTSEIDYATACGSTALGVDAFFLVVKCGDVRRVLGARVTLFDGSSVLNSWIAGTTTTPPNTLTETLYKTAAGNIFLRGILTGLDTASGKLFVEIDVDMN